MSTLKTTNIQHASAASAAITLNANGQATLNGLAYPTSGSLSGRNRIINGDMRIDQRNAGASGTGNDNFTVDRWAYFGSQASKGTWQQNAGSVTPPADFSNYLGFTSSSSYSVGATELFALIQKIEGFNTSDLNFGSASAKSVTISFWVRSSLTGTFGGWLANSGQTRNYPFSYSINAANTWEYKAVSITGDTSGSWVGSTNGIGMRVGFSLGTGSTNSTTANAWNGTTSATGVTGATSVVATNGATFYITGVQLEAGSVATPFERRSYGQELALCQRYYQKYTALEYRNYCNNVVRDFKPLPIAMRANPITTNSGWTGNLGQNNTTGYTGHIGVDFSISPIGSTGVLDIYGGAITLNAEL